MAYQERKRLDFISSIKPEPGREAGAPDPNIYTLQFMYDTPLDGSSKFGAYYMFTWKVLGAPYPYDKLVGETVTKIVNKTSKWHTELLKYKAGDIIQLIAWQKQSEKNPGKFYNDYEITSLGHENVERPAKREENYGQSNIETTDF